MVAAELGYGDEYADNRLANKRAETPKYNNVIITLRYTSGIDMGRPTRGTFEIHVGCTMPTRITLSNSSITLSLRTCRCYFGYLSLETILEIP